MELPNSGYQDVPERPAQAEFEAGVDRVAVVLEGIQQIDQGIVFALNLRAAAEAELAQLRQAGEAVPHEYTRDTAAMEQAKEGNTGPMTAEQVAAALVRVIDITRNPNRLSGNLRENTQPRGRAAGRGWASSERAGW